MTVNKTKLLLKFHIFSIYISGLLSYFLMHILGFGLSLTIYNTTARACMKVFLNLFGDIIRILLLVFFSYIQDFRVVCNDFLYNYAL